MRSQISSVLILFWLQSFLFFWSFLNKFSCIQSPVLRYTAAPVCPPSLGCQHPLLQVGQEKKKSPDISQCPRGSEPLLVGNPGPKCIVHSLEGQLSWQKRADCVSFFWSKMGLPVSGYQGGKREVLEQVCGSMLSPAQFSVLSLGKEPG